MSTISQYVTNQFLDTKKEEIGIGGFTTLARVRERYSRTSTVPTVFLEDGTHINDHIIRDPLTLLIEGSVSDVYIRPSVINKGIRRAQDIVGIILQYLPERTQAQASVVSGLVADVTNQIDRVDAVIASGQQLSGLIGLTDPTAQSNIERFISDMEAHYYSDYLISIDMPYRRYDNMRITSIEVERDNENVAISFRLEAQQLRFTETIVSPITLVEFAPAPSDGLDGQTEGVIDKGVQQGTEVQSAASIIFDSIGG